MHFVRPQPLGLDPWPAGGLLIPAGPGHAAFAAARVAGETPSAPDSLTFFARALHDDLEGARVALAGSDDPTARYNAFVLAPDASRLEFLRREFRTIPELAEQLEVAAFAAGLRDAPPRLESLDGELLGAALAAVASASLEAEDLDTASATLQRGIDAAAPCSPALAVHLLLSQVEVERRRRADTATCRSLLEQALELLRGHDGHAVLRAEVQLELGVLLQETLHLAPRPGQLDAAILHFQDALRTLDATRHRRAFGFAQMRLGLCYLARRTDHASDGLRLGVAAQALDKAVTILTPEHEPDLWSAAATNLANVWQVLPSNHLADNLDKALDLYERVLALRDPAHDPVGHARTQLNRGQAAASLERWDTAVEALEAATTLFQRASMTAEHLQAAGLLADLRRRRATTDAGPAPAADLEGAP